MSDTFDRCLAAAKAVNRTYPDGYGFALRYLNTDRPEFNPAWLRDCARRIVSETFENEPEYVHRNDPDLIRYVNAQQHQDWEHWLIEAAQLVHTAAMAGDPDACRVMALCGHPGYYSVEGPAS